MLGRGRFLFSLLVCCIIHGMSKDAAFPEDKIVRSTMKPHRPGEQGKRKKRKRQRQNHGNKDGELPEPALEVRGRPIRLPSLSDSDAFLIERLLGTPLI